MSDPVNELAIEDICSQPDDILRFPDFILGALARRGIGVVEAALAGNEGEPLAPMVSWQYGGRGAQSFETIAEVPRSQFRTILARFAFFSGLNPYAGQATFAVRWPVGGAPVAHRFSIFLCNEPAMAFWIRIYLYAIDEV